MLYLLGGTARSGKSAIARRFLAETKVPFFCLDYLMMGFANGLPEYGVDPEDDEFNVGDRLWPVVKPMATALVEDEIDYLIEGAQLRPQQAWTLSQAFPGDIRTCFTGFAEVDTRAKFAELRRFGGGSDDWMQDFDDRKMLQEIERLKTFSQKVKLECHQYNLHYVEASLDLHETVETVVQYLQGRHRG